MHASEVSPEPRLRVENLRTHLSAGRRPGGRRPCIKAVDGVTFEIRQRQTFGLVGESGCGKSTLARTILRLLPATGGRVLFDGRDVLRWPRRELAELRRQLQIIFQDPVSSLNPRLRVEMIVGESLTVHGLVRGRPQRRERVAELLQRVGLSAGDIDRYPHEFSGGQRQRIGIARALALGPQLVICDEPVSALDVSVQAQVLNLLEELRDGLGLSYLLIAHDLAVVQHASDEVAVMYLGRIVEQAPTDELFNDPRHPYTQALLAAVPHIDRVAARDAESPQAQEPPNPAAPPPGCAYHPRCPRADEHCARVSPMLEMRADLPPVHRVACHYAERT